MFHNPSVCQFWGQMYAFLLAGHICEWDCSIIRYLEIFWAICLENSYTIWHFQRQWVRFQFLCAVANICYSLSFCYSHPGKCQLVLHCGLDLDFHNTYRLVLHHLKTDIASLVRIFIWVMHLFTSELWFFNVLGPSSLSSRAFTVLFSHPACCLCSPWVRSYVVHDFVILVKAN